jgi:hypothetical protein
MLAAEDVECLIRRADIGRGFFDDAAYFPETLRRLGADFAHFAMTGVRPS